MVGSRDVHYNSATPYTHYALTVKPLSLPFIVGLKQSWILQPSTFRGEFNANKIRAIRVPQKNFFSKRFLSPYPSFLSSQQYFGSEPDKIQNWVLNSGFLLLYEQLQGSWRRPLDAGCEAGLVTVLVNISHSHVRSRAPMFRRCRFWKVLAGFII
jgi:hypothetical protein